MQNIKAMTGWVRVVIMLLVGLIFTLTIQPVAVASCGYGFNNWFGTMTIGDGSALTMSTDVTPSSGSCTWSAATNSPNWIHISTGGDYTGTATVTYTIDANNTGVERIGTITIANQTGTVIQKPAHVAGSCGYGFNNWFGTITIGDGSVMTMSTAVTPSSGSCTWSAATNSPGWIHISTGGNYTGIATVTYTIDANNTGAERIGTITIANQTGTVIQEPVAAASCGYSFNNWFGTMTIGDGSALAMSTAVTPSPGSCTWSAATNSPGWIHISTGGNYTGTATVTYTIDANNTGVERIGTITIANQTGTVIQKPAAVANSNSIGARNSIKITDMSGSLSTSGAVITVAAWDVNGNVIPESSSAAPLILYNKGTTTIAGTDLAARFPTSTPVSYEFSVGSSKYIITNIKSSADGSINIPYVYKSGEGGGI